MLEFGSEWTSLQGVGGGGGGRVLEFGLFYQIAKMGNVGKKTSF